MPIEIDIKLLKQTLVQTHMETISFQKSLDFAKEQIYLSANLFQPTLYGSNKIKLN